MKIILINKTFKLNIKYKYLNNFILKQFSFFFKSILGFMILDNLKMSKIIKLRKVHENNRPTRYSSKNNYKVEFLCRYFMVRFFFKKNQ